MNSLVMEKVWKSVQIILMKTPNMVKGSTLRKRSISLGTIIHFIFNEFRLNLFHDFIDFIQSSTSLDQVSHSKNILRHRESVELLSTHHNRVHGNRLQSAVVRGLKCIIAINQCFQLLSAVLFCAQVYHQH